MRKKLRMICQLGKVTIGEIGGCYAFSHIISVFKEKNLCLKVPEIYQLRNH